MSVNGHCHESCHYLSFYTYCSFTTYIQADNFLLVLYFALNGLEGEPVLFTIIYIMIGL